MENLYLVIFVFLYLVVTVIIWLYASKKVKNEKDYLIAWRKLPIHITIATVFATWFWSETVLGTSSTFIDEWLLWIMADPFWASLCLILVGLFFAKPLYKLWIITLWDFYKLKYWRTVEMLASICIMISYIWWVSAQIVALWIIFNVLSAWEISVFWWSWIWASIVLIYTFWWWMWSVALNDFIQMIMIMLWIIIATFFITFWVDWWLNTIINHAVNNSKFVLFPDWFSFFALSWILFALLTMWFWSIPQQDVFQRVLSAKNENIAKWWSIIWWSLYFIFAFFPITLWYAAFVVAPDLIEKVWDSQLVLPTLILESTPLIIQILFFWALISAIMSTASATILAPSALFAHNIIKPFLDLSEKELLKLTRFVLIWCFIIVMWFVTYKFQNEEANIFNMVENAYKITLAWAFIPLVAWIVVKKTHTISWLLSIIFGIGIWIAMEVVNPEHPIPPQFWGLFASIIWFALWQILWRIYWPKDEK